MRVVPHFINGVLVEEVGHSRVFNPATGEVIANVPVPPLDFINSVVATARDASVKWAQSSLSMRTNVLFSLRQLIVEHTEELASIITLEHGKTIADSKGEIARAKRARYIALFSHEALRGRTH